MKNYIKLIDELGSKRVLKNELLGKYTTLKIGGPADLFFEAERAADLVKAIRLAVKYHIPYFVMSGGTNLVISDKGYRGLVIKNKTSKIKPIKITSGTKGDKIYIKADSGVLVNRLVRYTLDQGLKGLEYFSGQPGAIGGAVWINAHNMKAGGKFIGDSIVEAELISATGEVKKEPRSYFNFGYDSSKIQETKEVVLSVVFELLKGDREKLWSYAGTVLEHRRTTQPLNYPSSGCSFRNISLSNAKKIGTPDNTTSAGYLIDSLGLKGKLIGGAMFSEKHAAFIVNVNDAKAADVKALLDLVKKKVKANYGIELREEVALVGEF